MSKIKPHKKTKKIQRKPRVVKRVMKKEVAKRKRVKKHLPLALIKPEENPIISPILEHDWEAWQTFNPGVILLADKVHFLYRAVGKDGISRFGYACSRDGFLISERLPQPVYEHYLIKPGINYYSPAPLDVYNLMGFASGGSFGGAEDARPVRVGEENTIYMTYTACDEGLRVGLTSIKVGDFLKKKWQWKTPILISPPGEVHKNWVIFPEKIKGKYAILHSLSPQVLIDYRETLNFKEGEYISSFYNGKTKDEGWEAQIRGIGPLPIKTKYGWLLFYHGIDKLDPGKYKVGAMLLDLSSPEIVLMRSREPILEPDEIYENNGFKPGVVYASGAVVKNGEIIIYYGAADSYVCAAYADFEEFTEMLKKEIKPKLKYRPLKKKI